jgi:hypothetical protein
MFQIHPESVILKYGLVIFTDRGLVAIEGEEAFSHTTHTCDDDDQTAASSERRPEQIPASPLLAPSFPQFRSPNCSSTAAFAFRRTKVNFFLIIGTEKDTRIGSDQNTATIAKQHRRGIRVECRLIGL